MAVSFSYLLATLVCAKLPCLKKTTEAIKEILMVSTKNTITNLQLTIKIITITIIGT